MNEVFSVGFVGFGEINSPKELIDAKCLEALDKIKSLGYQVHTTDTVTDDPAGTDVSRAIDEMKSKKIDVLIICLAGWIPSHAVIAVTDAFRHHPMILWGLCGDIEGGRIVTAAAQAGTTALRKVFADLGYKYRYFYNIIGRPIPIDAISSYISAIRARKILQSSRVGMMGFRDMKLYNTLYEGISLKQKLGVEVDFFETLEMLQYTEKVSENEIDDLLSVIQGKWNFIQPVDSDFLKRGITYYLALRKLMHEKPFQAISLKDVDGMKKLLQFPPAMVFMLLADEADVCTIPENDTMGAVTQLIVKAITGQSAAYLEFYEFFEGSLLMGVPDYVPGEVVDGKVTVTNAAFGGISGGLLNVSTIKTGQLTLARLSNSAASYEMHIATGDAKLRAWEEAGWTQPAPQLPSLEIFLDKPVKEFANKISGQHYIIAYGDHTEALKDFCYLNDIKVV
jgi:L-fucose isomerase-like protein